MVLMDVAGLALLTLQRRKVCKYIYVSMFSTFPLRFLQRTIISLCNGLLKSIKIYLLYVNLQQRLGLHNEWKGFLGELLKSQKPLYIEGCYANRSFTVHDSFGDVVAEVCFTLIHFSVSWISCIFRLFFSLEFLVYSDYF